MAADSVGTALVDRLRAAHRRGPVAHQGGQSGLRCRWTRAGSEPAARADRRICRVAAGAADDRPEELPAATFATAKRRHTKAAAAGPSGEVEPCSVTYSEGWYSPVALCSRGLLRCSSG